MSYHSFKGECADCNTASPEEAATCETCGGSGVVMHGSLEVFEVTGTEIRDGLRDDLQDEGWYWWACFPGCLPDGDPSGPFKTEQEAIDDANS